MPRPSLSDGSLRRGLVMATLGTLALLACACGSSSTPSGRAATPAGPLLEGAQAALAGENVVHLSGTLTAKSGSTTVSIAVDATSAGAAGNAEGTLTLEGPGLGFEGTTRYSVVNGTTYVYAGTPFWKGLFGKQTSKVAALEAQLLPEVVDRWVQLPSASTDVIYKDTFGLSAPKEFVSGSLSGVKGKLTNEGDRTLDGVSGVEVTSNEGAAILVAASGPPVPLAISGTGPGGFDLSLAVTYPGATTIAAPVHPVSLAAIEAALTS